MRENVERQHVQHAAELFNGGLQRFELLALGGDGKENLSLAPSALYRVVRNTKVLVVGQEAGNPFPGLGWLEHVVADEVIQVTDGFHRNGLVEQVQRLLGDSHGRAEGGRILREGVENLGGALQAEALLEGDTVTVKCGEVRQHGHFAARGHEQPLYLPALQPE